MSEPMLDRNYKQKVFLRGFLQGKNMFRAIKAMELTISVHKGKRRSGDVEFSHQLEVVIYLCQVLEKKVEPHEFDIIVTAAFLHDIVEDYPNKYSFDKMRDDFGSEVTEAVKLVTKSMDYDKHSEKDREKYYDAILRNPHAVFVKGADRIHNMQTYLHGSTSEKLKFYMAETEDHILPLIKSARKTYPEYYLIFISMSHLLQKQLYFLKEILKEREKRAVYEDLDFKYLSK
ncbi:HD domain-containing protein [Candidatus Peregrinibacteria bacterium]|nr:HD domain-containing protein [Candidatus Peregrinibacteria bacterium]